MTLATETTSTSPRSAGSKLGNKIGGVVEAVHGIGESLRGNTMSMLDEATGTGRGRTQNNQVADAGRLEMREGLDRLGMREKVRELPPRSTGASTLPNETARHEHHRDEAISGLPSRQEHELSQRAEVNGGTQRMKAGQSAAASDEGLEYV